jgi:hypothetical protein
MTTSAPQKVPPVPSKRFGHFLALAGLLLGAAIVFGDVLSHRGEQVLSKYGEDVTGEFVAFRAFGFGELAHGHAALWNPYIYCGAPFLANFQSALLYPPNRIYLLLPVNEAINIEISFHVLLAGICMYAWCAYRGLHPLAAFLAGMAFMFGGGFYAHVFPGHLPHLDVIAWAPLVMLAVDDLTMTRSLRGIWLGAAAVAMQILAGHPQFVFYTGVGAGLYALFNLRQAPEPKKCIIGLVSMFALAAALAAVQLGPGLAAAGETVRTRLDPQTAGASSLPPEALPSLILPGLFGPYQSADGGWEYWGRTEFWESCLFVGLTVLSLAIFAVVRVPKRARRFAATLSLLSLLMALGKYTPLFHLLYHIPGFASFRAWGRFDMLTLLFLALLGGLGLDRLLKGVKPGKLPAILLALLAIVLLAGALLLVHESHSGVAGAWGKGLSYRARLASHSQFTTSAEYVERTAHNAALELLRAGMVAGVLAVLWWTVRLDRRVAYLMVVIAALELIGFARRYRPTFDWASFNAQNAETAEKLRSVDGSDRMWANLQDIAIRDDCPEAWGYDATILQRYADLISATQDVAMSDLVQWGTKPHMESPVWRLLRVRSFAVNATDGERVIITPYSGPVLERAMLLADWRVVPDRRQIVAAIKDQTFDPGQTALLEQPVSITPSGTGSAGTVQCHDINSDEIELTIDAKRPAIMVLADNYATGWQVIPLAGGSSDQNAYQVVPVDTVLRGIPVVAGKHHLLLQYHPKSVTAGAWISTIAWALFALSGAGAMLINSRATMKPSS